MACYKWEARREEFISKKGIIKNVTFTGGLATATLPIIGVILEQLDLP